MKEKTREILSIVIMLVLLAFLVWVGFLLIKYNTTLKELYEVYDANNCVDVCRIFEVLEEQGMV